jgi:hypothetical protein
VKYAYSGSRTVVVVVAIVNTNTESMRVSTGMEYVDVVASKWKLSGGRLWPVVALTLPQVRY